MLWRRLSPPMATNILTITQNGGYDRCVSTDGNDVGDRTATALWADTPDDVVGGGIGIMALRLKTFRTVPVIKYI